MSDTTATVTVVAQTPLFTVLDGVLGAEQRDRLWNYFQLQPFQRVDALGLQGQWLLEDSAVLRGPTVGWGQAWDAQYPTKTPIDDLMKAVADAAPHFAATAGARGAEWDVFSAAPTLYAAGQGLVWHRDGDDDTGSWIYYAHREWNIEWGGELFVAHESALPAEYGAFLHRLRPMAEMAAAPAWPSHLDNQDANQLLMERGIGSYIAPKPNRLVIVKGGAPYAIAKVRPSAGRQVHASVGGSFKRRDRG